MRIAELKQGTEAWKAWRKSHFNASDAAAMLGISPYKTRNELLREYATGITEEPDAATQRRFDEGHRAEALARALAEEICGELFPITGEWDEDERISASFDGLNMEGDHVWEHKALNANLEKAFPTEAKDYIGIFWTGYSTLLPEHYRAQLEQQLIVSGAKSAGFWATKWDGDTLVKRCCTHYESDEKLRQRIIDGWAQFAEDLKTWQPEESAPVVIGVSPETMPALSIRAEGRIIVSNLVEYIAGVRAIVAGIKTTLVTDQDFGDAEKTVKWAKKAEETIDTAIAAMLAQTADIGAAKNQMEGLKEELRDVRLKLDKLVKSEKERRKTEMINAALDDFREHQQKINFEFSEWFERLGRPVLFSMPQPYFGESIKGMSKIEHIQNALDTTVANSKIAMDAKAREWREKFTWFAETAREHRNLFHDLQTLIEKPLEDFKLAVTSRIERQKREEAERLEAERARLQKEAEAKAEAERERIRKEEAAKLEAEAKARETARLAQEAAERERLHKEAKAREAAEAKAAQAVANDSKAWPASLRPGERNAFNAPVEQEAPSTLKPVPTEMAKRIIELIAMLDEKELALAVHYIERLIEHRQDDSCNERKTA